MSATLTPASVVENFDTSSRYQAHPLVRVEPLADDKWQISREDHLQGHHVAPLIAAVLIATFKTSSVPSISSLLDNESLTETRVAEIVGWLSANEYVLPADDPDAEATRRWLANWEANGWRAAARYHARTYGYPFEFYEVDGSSDEDVRRMVAYNAEKPDVERARPRIQNAAHSYLLPDPDARLFPALTSEVISANAAEREIEREEVVNVVSLLSRPVRRDAMPYPEAADLLRKTSPSGGSRHPTEIYIFANKVTGLTDGIYQVAPVDGTIDSIDRLVEPTEHLPESLRNAPKTASWVVLLYSTYFARNRYRYREPRTFRTIHMDVGHLMGTAEYLAHANGWQVEHVQHLNGRALASELGIDPYVESPIAATFISKNGANL